MHNYISWMCTHMVDSCSAFAICILKGHNSWNTVHVVSSMEVQDLLNGIMLQNFLSELMQGLRCIVTKEDFMSCIKFIFTLKKFLFLISINIPTSLLNILMSKPINQMIQLLPATGSFKTNKLFLQKCIELNKNACICVCV